MLLRVAVVLIALLAIHYAVYPYGQRPCTVSCLTSALSTFANVHQGQYPRSLSELYPSYTSYRVLAGLSGDIEATRRALELGQSIEFTSSWRYPDGIPNGGVRLLVYDVTTISGPGGVRRFDAGRWVGFSDGSVRRIPLTQWDSFLRAHTRDRRAAE